MIETIIREGILKAKTRKDFKTMIDDFSEKEIIENVLYKGGLSFIFGEPSTGKSWITIDTAIRLADGKPTWLGIPKKPQKILFFEAEFPEELMIHRLTKLDKSVIEENFLILSILNLAEYNTEIDFTLNSEIGKKCFEEYIKINQPDIVIIDSFGSFTKNSHEKSVLSAIEYLKRITIKYNCHVMIIHHPTKASMTGNNREKDLSQGDLIGSSAISRFSGTIFAVNSIFNNEGFKESMTGKICHLKNWYGAEIPFTTYVIKKEEDKIKIEFLSETYSSLVIDKEKE